MGLISATDLPPGSPIETDVCVVGAGPAGLTVANELCRAGIDTCVLESGVTKPDEEIQSLNALVNAGHPLRPNFVNRRRGIGGTSALWVGRCMPLDPIDYAARNWVSGSGWPIPYAEYLSYLRAAGALMALPGEETASVGRDNSDARPGSHHLFGGDSGLSEKIALWARRPPRFWDMLGPGLKGSASCRIVSGLTVTGLQLDPAGRRLEALTAVHSRTGRLHQVRPRRTVLATGGIENARLLLLARLRNPQAAIPDWPLGRYYMDHARSVYGRVRLNPGVDLTDYLGRPLRGGMSQFGVGLDDQAQRDGRWLNCYCHLEAAASHPLGATCDAGTAVMKRILRRGQVGRRFYFTDLAPIKDLIYQLTPRELLPHGVYRRYFALRSRFKAHSREIVIVNHCEPMPSPSSRITLDDTLDRFGNPLPRLDWRVDPLETKTLEAIHARLAAFLSARGLGRLLTPPQGVQSADYFDSSHHMGGTRMGDSPRSGVVDTNLRVHGLDNLYVCGSSVFPTGGSVNPTWSIVALALRLGAYIAGPPGSRQTPPSVSPSGSRR